jgi:hypothetical protein
VLTCSRKSACHTSHWESATAHWPGALLLCQKSNIKRVEWTGCNRTWESLNGLGKSHVATPGAANLMGNIERRTAYCASSHGKRLGLFSAEQPKRRALEPREQGMLAARVGACHIRTARPNPPKTRFACCLLCAHTPSKHRRPPTTPRKTITHHGAQSQKRRDGRAASLA